MLLDGLGADPPDVEGPDEVEGWEVLVVEAPSLDVVDFDSPPEDPPESGEEPAVELAAAFLGDFFSRESVL